MINRVMRRSGLFISVFLLMAMVLAACGQSNTPVVVPTVTPAPMDSTTVITEEDAATHDIGGRGPPA